MMYQQFCKKLPKSVFIKITAVLLMLFFIAVSSIGAYATGASAHKRTVRVGYGETYGTISSTDGKSYSGYGYEYLMEISKHTGWTYEFVLVEWEDGLEQLKTGEIDLFGPMQYSARRDEFYYFPTEPAGYEDAVMYAAKDNETLYYEDFPQFNNLRVATMENNFHNEKFERYSKEHGFKAEYTYYNDPTALAAAVKTGEADVFIAGSMIMEPDVKIVGKFATEPFYFAASKADPKLIEDYGLAVEKIKADNPYYTAALHSKYYKDDVLRRTALTKAETEFVKNCPPLRIIYDSAWSPIEYYDEKTDSFQGIHAGLLELLSQYSGFQFEYIRSVDLEETREYVSAGKADGVAGHFSGKLGRLTQSTETYIEIPFVLVGKQGASITDKAAIGLSQGNAHLAPVVMESYSNARIVLLEDTAACLEALRSNEIDIGMINSYTFDELVKTGKYSDLFILSVSPVSLPMRLSFLSHVDPMVCSILNKAIAHISFDEKNAVIMNNTINRHYDIPIGELLEQYAVYWIVGIAVLAMVIMAGLGLMRRTHMNRLQQIAYYDSLTGIRNLDKFKLDAAVILKKNPQEHFAILYGDIDKFKYINDIMGYSTGNHILKEVALLLERNLQEDEIVARAFADNFVALIKRKNDKEVMQRLRLLEGALTEQIGKPHNYLQLFFNIGIYTIASGDDINGAIDNANLARKTVKGGHKSTLAFYDDTLHNRILEQIEIESTMKDALQNNEFVVHIQPKYTLSSGKMAGGEALVRWNSPTKGMIYPGDFIPIFERNGFVVSLDMFVLEEVCKKVKQWQDRGLDPVPTISVNLSRINLNNDKLADNLIYLTKLYGVSPRSIEIEITESTIYGNADMLLTLMQQLQAKGFSISMDDFGTGYSSLNLLKDLPINVLKLDKEFLSSASDTSKGKKVISNMVYMAQNLNIKVVAEGVETREQAAFLKEINCDMAQGYYFARPMPMEHFEKLIFPTAD